MTPQPKAAFKWPKRIIKPQSRPEPRGLKDTYIRDTEQITLIQGQEPMSKQEWRVSKALDILKIDYQYQVPIMGGRGVRGGQVVDFVAYAPFKTPINVNGGYWHNGQMKPDEILNQAMMAEYFGREPIILWEHELGSVADAMKALQIKLL